MLRDGKMWRGEEDRRRAVRKKKGVEERRGGEKRTGEEL